MSYKCSETSACPLFALHWLRPLYVYMPKGGDKDGD